MKESLFAVAVNDQSKAGFRRNSMQNSTLNR